MLGWTAAKGDRDRVKGQWAVGPELAKRKIVVVGADAAGMSAAHQALREADERGRAVEVVVLERTADTSYSACGIPYWIAGDVTDADDLRVRTAEEHRAKGVDLRMGVTATELDLDRRRVAYRTSDGATAYEAFDDLVLATGAAALVPGWARDEAGGLVKGVHPVRSLADGQTWLDAVGGRTRSEALVVGGGYIGVEMAEALVRRGLKTTLLTRSEVMSTLDPDMGARVREGIAAAGIEVVTGAEVSSLERAADGRVGGVATKDGRTFAGGLVVLGLGAKPASELGERAGLPVGAFGGYLPDERGRLAEGVWAAGDCCEVTQRLTGGRTFVPLGTHANKLGRVIGENLGGGDARFGGVVGTAITRFAAGDVHLEIARTGLNSAEAAAAGLTVSCLVTEGRTASGYMPEASPIAVKVLAEPGTRRLLGLQIVGGRNAGKRVDTAAAALWGSMTVDELAGMDLAYAPPFATVWEAVQLAARRSAERL